MRRLLSLSLLAALAPLTAPAPAAALDRLCDVRYEDCRAPLLNLINSEPAGGAIDVAFWFMEDDRYRAALVAAKNRGVRVRVLVDPRANATKRLNEQILKALADGGIQMRYKVAQSWGDILHWKMMYFADSNVVQFSAANYSPASFVPLQPYSDYIDEVIYFTDDVRLTRSFNTKFENYWTDQTGFKDYANVSGPQPRYYPISPIDPALNFPPDQDYAVKATTHYKREFGLPGAAIDVTMYRMSDARHADVMISAVQQGIPVRLITEQENYRDSRYIWHSYNADRMWAAGVQVKDRAHAGIVHQKTVVLHGQKEVIHGSSNWSSASSNQQLEHNIFSLPCTPGQTTWCDANNWFYDYFAAQFTSKWNASSEFQAFTPRPGGTPVNSSPANGAANVSTTVTLRWDGGNWNHKYDVYLGTDPLNLTRVATDIVVGSPYTGQYETWTVPSALSPGTTYYWRVVGKTAAEGPRAAALGLNLSKPGPTWSFTTAGTAPPPDPGGLSPFGGTPVSLPGRIEAENFDNGGQNVAYFDTTAGNSGGKYRSTDVDIASTSDTGGGYNLGYTRPSEWLKYSVNVTASGTYSLRLRYAYVGTSTVLRVEVDDVDKTGPITVSGTGGWQSWRDVTVSGINLAAGAHVVKLVFVSASDSASANVNYLVFSNSAPVNTPFGGSPAAVPGRIEAENFDEGGQNVAYFDTTAGNSGGKYRSTDVDIASTTDAGGGYNIGYARPTEWLKYTVEVAASGTYNLTLRYAFVGTSTVMRVEVDDVDKTGPISVAGTGGWQSWRDVTVSGISLSGGTHVVKLVFVSAPTGSASANVNYLQFTSSASATSTPYGGSPVPLPGLIEAENFDEGGPGVAYFDTTAGNSGGQYRATDVDIAASSDTGNGYNTGYARPGEWLKYTVDVVSAGVYTLTLRYAYVGPGATIQIQMDDVDKTGPLQVSDTGGWQVWESLAVGGIELPAGTHVLKVVHVASADEGPSANINHIEVS